MPVQGPHQSARRSLQPPVEECAIAFARSRAGELRQPHRLRRKITRPVHRRMRRRFRERARHDQPVLQETTVGALVPTRELVRARPASSSARCGNPSFNPRARERRDHIFNDCWRRVFVSTHAPLWGATMESVWGPCTIFWFQPTRPYGARPAATADGK